MSMILTGNIICMVTLQLIAVYFLIAISIMYAYFGFSQLLPTRSFKTEKKLTSSITGYRLNEGKP